MKPMLRKTLIIGSCIVAPVAIIGLGAGLYFGTPTIERISKKGVYVARINETLNNEGYKFDYSASYGSILSTSKPSILLTNEILHLRSEGNLRYDQKTKTIPQPSFESYEFGIANGIVLTFIHSSVTKEQVNNKNIPEDKYFQLIFNSDEAEVLPIWDPNTNKDPVKQKTSKNPRSINNPNVFGKISSIGYLKEKIDLDAPNLTIDTTEKNFVLAGMGITFDKNARWVDSNGKLTKYEIVPEDMFYSIKRTWLFDRKYRLKNGGTEALDNYFIEKTQTSKIFGLTQKYPNEYLFDFFGIIKEDLYDKTKAIQKVNPNTENEQEAFTFAMNIFSPSGQIDTNSSFSIGDIIKKYLVNSITFSLAPSKYIKENLASNEALNRTKAGEITGEAREFGIYTYAQKRTETLFASAYVPIKSQAGQEVYVYNKHYANKKWVDSVEKGVEVKDENGKTKIQKTINKVVLSYTGGIDTATFTNQAFNSFMNGTLSELDYALLNDSQKKQLYGDVPPGASEDKYIENSKSNGLRVTKKINKSSLTSRTVWQANPINNKEGYGFNDTYAKLVYGSTLDEIKKGNVNTANKFFAGTGFHFRNLVQASINWDYYINWAYSSTRDAWLSGAAQDAIFSSTNPESLKPVDFNEMGVNDLFFFDENDAKQSVTLKEMKQHTMNNSDRYILSQSPKFEDIKKSMKKLLDKFYADNNLDSTKDKIEWDIPYSFADKDETKVAATKFIVNEVINKLDDRLNPRFQEPNNRDELLSAINQKKGAYNANLWSYDYEGIGSYFAAFFSDGGGVNLLGAVSLFSKDQNTAEVPNLLNLQNEFPKFTEMAKFIKTKVNEKFDANNQTTNEKFKVENWDKISNSDMNHLATFFEDPIGNPNKVNPISLIPVVLKMFELEASWEKDANNTKEQKGQAWSDLIKEFNSIKGVSIDTETSVEKLSNVNYVLFLKEYIVPVSSDGVNLFSNLKYEQEVDK